MSIVVDNPYVRKTSLYYTIFDVIANSLIYQCIYLNYVCSRVMFGPDFWIYDPTELENTNILLVLQKADCIIPCELIYQKIKDYNIKCEYINDDKAYHGSVLMDKAFIPKMNDILQYFN